MEFLVIISISIALFASARGQDQGSVRLVNGLSSYQGRVEIFLDGRWGTICDHEWDIYSAIVVCKQLGFENADRAVMNSYFGPSSGAILLYSVYCSGYESRLDHCNVTVSDPGSTCSHSAEAGVICSDPDSEYLSVVTVTATTFVCLSIAVIFLAFCVKACRKVSTHSTETRRVPTISGQTTVGVEEVHYNPSSEPDDPPAYSAVIADPTKYPIVCTGSEDPDTITPSQLTGPA